MLLRAEISENGCMEHVYSAHWNEMKFVENRRYADSEGVMQKLTSLKKASTPIADAEAKFIAVFSHGPQHFLDRDVPKRRFVKSSRSALLLAGPEWLHEIK